MAKRKNTKGQIRSTKHTHKTKDCVTRIPLKTGGELRCSGRVGSCCSTSGTRGVNLLTNPVINHFTYIWSLRFYFRWGLIIHSWFSLNIFLMCVLFSCFQELPLYFVIWSYTQMKLGKLRIWQMYIPPVMWTVMGDPRYYRRLPRR